MSDTHRATSVTRDGAAQGLCFRSPRHLRSIKWTLEWSMVTCHRCLAKRQTLPGDTGSADHAKRWRALSASTQAHVIFRLASDIRNREKTLNLGTFKSRSEGGQFNRTKARMRLAADRALLDLLEGVTDASVFVEARDNGEKP